MKCDIPESTLLADFSNEIFGYSVIDKIVTQK